MKRKLHDYYTW